MYVCIYRMYMLYVYPVAFGNKYMYILYEYVVRYKVFYQLFWKKTKKEKAKFPYRHLMHAMEKASHTKNIMIKSTHNGVSEHWPNFCG